jgi:hypothetical protein
VLHLPKAGAVRAVMPRALPPGSKASRSPRAATGGLPRCCTSGRSSCRRTARRKPWSAATSVFASRWRPPPAGSMPCPG